MGVNSSSGSCRQLVIFGFLRCTIYGRLAINSAILLSTLVGRYNKESRVLFLSHAPVYVYVYYRGPHRLTESSIQRDRQKGQTEE